MERPADPVFERVRRGIDCSANLPYPKVDRVQPNRRYARILQNLSNSKVSEMTASAQYMFQHILVEETNREIAQTLRCIGITEMRHLELLGGVILKLGEVPRYGVNTGGEVLYWTGRNVNYVEGIRELLLADISDEKQAIGDYNAAIAAIDDEEITALLGRIILDEEVHLTLLNALYRKYA